MPSKLFAQVDWQSGGNFNWEFKGSMCVGLFVFLGDIREDS